MYIHIYICIYSMIQFDIYSFIYLCVADGQTAGAKDFDA